jgi:hypothetical protein
MYERLAAAKVYEINLLKTLKSNFSLCVICYKDSFDQEMLKGESGFRRQKVYLNK